MKMKSLLIAACLGMFAMTGAALAMTMAPSNPVPIAFYDSGPSVEVAVDDAINIAALQNEFAGSILDDMATPPAERTGSCPGSKMQICDIGLPMGMSVHAFNQQLMDRRPPDRI